MRYTTQVKSISYLKANAADMLDKLAEQREPVLITQNGEARAVLQDVASYEEMQETLALLKLLALGQQAPGGQARRQGCGLTRRASALFGPRGRCA